MTDAQDKKAPTTFKCPLSQEVLEQLHMVTGKLKEHKKGDEVDVDEYQALIGEYLLNAGVVDREIEQSDNQRGPGWHPSDMAEPA